MTIHSDWLHLMKANCPGAFTKDVPFTPEIAFIDGQIKLMAMCKPVSGGTPTWECFLQRQFVRPIENHWRSTYLLVDTKLHIPLPQPHSRRQATEH